MQFLLLCPDASILRPLLAHHGHTGHAPDELPHVTPPAPENLNAPQTLLSLLAKKQWNLLTTNAPFIRALYEQKCEFAGTIIFLLTEKPDALDRLFARYHRLAPRRLYTVTDTRVKIRQLPGGHV